MGLPKVTSYNSSKAQISRQVCLAPQPTAATTPGHGTWCGGINLSWESQHLECGPSFSSDLLCDLEPLAPFSGSQFPCP